MGRILFKKSFTVKLIYMIYITLCEPDLDWLRCLFQVKIVTNTPGTAGGPGGRDRTLAVKSRKIARKLALEKKKKKLPKFFFYIYLLVMPKYWGKQIFAHGRSHKVGQK